MSHLPPRPDFDYSRYPEPRTYTRPSPMAPPPPDRSYPPRDRDVYPPRSPPSRGDVYIPRSPPRPNPPRSEDTYIARDSYPPPRDSYLPPYERREGDRYRESYREREWERRDRDRDSDYRYRHRESSRERTDWPRERERDIDRRRWEEDSRRGYERDRRERSPIRDRAWTRPREDDRRLGRERAHEPPEPERTWVPRQSRSPPRRMAPDNPPGPSRGRTPSPRRRPRTPPSAHHTRPATPLYSSRHETSVAVSPNIKLGNHSISMSPRHTRDTHRLEENDRKERRDRSRSISPIRRSERSSEQLPHIDARNELYERHKATNYERSSRTVTPPPRERSRPASPIPSASLKHSHSPSPMKQDPTENVHPLREETRNMKAEARTVSLTVDKPSSVAPPTPKASYTSSAQLLPRKRRSPPTQPRNYVKTPTTPMSPHPGTPVQNLPPKPEWTNGSIHSAPATPAEPTQSAPVIPAPVIPSYTPPVNKHVESIEHEIARIRAHRMHATSEYVSTAKATRRALHELDMASIDLKFAENRRKFADAQLEKARFGLLGIDYVPPPTAVQTD